MPAYGSPAHRAGDLAGTLRLLGYIALGITLVVLDHRGGWLARVHDSAEVAMQPVWWLAGLPGRIGASARDNAATHTMLVDENRALRNALLVGNARQARLQAAAAENERMRGLLGAAQRSRLDVQLAPILNIDLDPTRQRLVLDAGAREGVRIGQTVIDAGGLLGQIVSRTQTTATVLLVTDPDHAVPVVVARTGVRLVLYGNGRSDQLQLANVPLSSDVKVGDSLVTSGLGGRFPPGFPVGTIRALRPDDSRAFLLGDVAPAAQLDRGRDVLLLRDVVVAGPRTSAPAMPSPGGAQANPATPAEVASPGQAPSNGSAGAARVTATTQPPSTQPPSTAQSSTAPPSTPPGREPARTQPTRTEPAP